MIGTLIGKCERRIRDYSRMSRRVGLLRAAVPTLARLKMYKAIYKVQIELTMRSIVKPVMCEHTSRRKRSSSMSIEQFKMVIDSLPRLVHVDMTGIGETLLYPDFIPAIEYLRSKSIFAAFTTNLSLRLRPGLVDAVLRDVDLVKVSIDAASRETYERIRRGARWELTIGNLRALSRERKGRRADSPRLRVVYTLLRENIRQVRNAVDLFGSMGVDAIDFQIPQLPDLTWHRRNRKRIYQIVERAATRNPHKGLTVNFSKYELDKPVVSSCSNAYNNAFVTVDGQVFPCCFIHHGGSRTDYMRHSFGNIFRLGEKIASSPARRAFVAQFERGDAPVLCRRCPVYSFEKEPA